MHPKAIFIYHDEGTSEVGVESLMIAVKEKLGFPTGRITAQEIGEGKLKEAMALVIPGGADLPYCVKLNGKGNQQIKTFVAEGGCYIGICAGAYYGCAEVAFQGEDEQGESYHINGKRELGFFQGVAQGSLAHLTSGRFYNEKSNTKAFVPIRLATGQTVPLYYHGGCCFSPYLEAYTASFSDVEVFATYSDGSPAIITGKYQQGHYFLSGVHFELQTPCYVQHIRKIEAENDRLLEQQILKQLQSTSDYGEAVWQKIAKIIAEMCDKIGK